MAEFATFCDTTGYRTDAEKQAIPGLAFVNETSSFMISNATWKAPGFSQTAECPVTCVSTRDTVEYCKWLSMTYKLEFRIPTYGEWQHAFKFRPIDSNSEELTYPTRFVNLGDHSLFEFETNRDKRLNVTKGPNPRAACFDDGFVFTAPVRAKKANRNGLYFMHGNVSEICSVSPDLVDEIQADIRGEMYAACGGGWFDECEASPSFIATPVPAQSAVNYISFRLVCEPKDE